MLKGGSGFRYFRGEISTQDGKTGICMCKKEKKNEMRKSKQGVKKMKMRGSVVLDGGKQKGQGAPLLIDAV